MLCDPHSFEHGAPKTLDPQVFFRLAEPKYASTSVFKVPALCMCAGQRQQTGLLIRWGSQQFTRSLMQSRAEQPPGWECHRPWACYIHSSKYDEASCSQLRSQCMGLTVCTCTALSLTTLTASILHSQTPHSLSQSKHSMSSGQSAAQSMHSMSSGQSAAHSSRACSCSRSSGMTGQG